MLAKNWDDNYNTWKSTVFKTLETRDMDDYAQSEFKKLVKLSRDYRVRLIFIYYLLVIFRIIKILILLNSKGEELGYH